MESDYAATYRANLSGDCKQDFLTPDTESIWLDLIHYSEMLLGVTAAARVNVLTRFFVPDAAVEKDALLKWARPY